MRFTANISAVLTFSLEEVEYLAQCAERHYDSRIQALVPPGPGAIINGMRVRLLPPSEGATTTCDYTFREIDLLTKAIEQEYGLIGGYLRQRFLKALSKINALGQAVNNLLEAAYSEGE